MGIQSTLLTWDLTHDPAPGSSRRRSRGQTGAG